MIERIGLPVAPGHDGAWELTEPLPWDRWDAETYRLRAGQETAPTSPTKPAKGRA